MYDLLIYELATPQSSGMPWWPWKLLVSSGSWPRFLGLSVQGGWSSKCGYSRKATSRAALWNQLPRSAGEVWLSFVGEDMDLIRCMVWQTRCTLLPICAAISPAGTGGTERRISAITCGGAVGFVSVPPGSLKHPELSRVHSQKPSGPSSCCSSAGWELCSCCAGGSGWWWSSGRLSVLRGWTRGHSLN